MTNEYPLFISVGYKFAFVPEGKSVLVKGGVGEIRGGKFDGVKIKGVTGAATHASFFRDDKDFKEVPLSELM